MVKMTTLSLPVNQYVSEKSLAIPYKKLNSEFQRAYDDVRKLLENFETGKIDRPILSKPNSNTKLSKETERTKNFKLYSLFLAPAGSSGYNTCAWSSPDCVKLCLNTSGRGAMESVQKARISKTAYMVEHPYAFMWSLLFEMNSAMRSAWKNKDFIAIRLNGTSDIPWESAAPFLEDFCVNGDYKDSVKATKKYPRFYLYDYTKSYARAIKSLPWYDMTFSYSGYNWKECKSVLDNKTARVAVVFKDFIPEEYEGYEVINGDLDDYRFLDRKGLIVGLKYKDTGRENGKIVSEDSSLRFVIRQ
jgi:hypothetical protein